MIRDFATDSHERMFEHLFNSESFGRIYGEKLADEISCAF